MFAAGALVTGVTYVMMPQSPAVFGVLTLLGSCMLILCVLDRYLCRIPPMTGVSVSFLSFLLLREVNVGWLGFEKIRLIQLPQSWYRNLLTAYIGFPAPEFVSTDYFPLLPWLFLFLTGYYLFHAARRYGKLHLLKGREVPIVNEIGRHSLLLYLLHQPLLYVFFEMVY